MRMITIVAATLFLALAGCGQAVTSNEAGAQTPAVAGAEASAEEKTALLAAAQLTADAQGQVENECGERVTPRFATPDLGRGVGRAVALIMEGGPNTAACYGDGPLVTLYRNDGGAWRQIYMNRGGGMIILPAQHNNGNDLADGGPGFSFPVWEWNGTEYVNARRAVPDSALSDARFVPD